jgi:hypothetical protein
MQSATKRASSRATPTQRELRAPVLTSHASNGQWIGNATEIHFNTRERIWTSKRSNLVAGTRLSVPEIPNRKVKFENLRFVSFRSQLWINMIRIYNASYAVVLRVLENPCQRQVTTDADQEIRAQMSKSLLLRPWLTSNRYCHMCLAESAK